jgi:hypothetical protein
LNEWILFSLLQTGAILYLIYRVHRLEQRIGNGIRPVRRANPGDGERKVIPLLKDQAAPSKERPNPPQQPKK